LSALSAYDRAARLLPHHHHGILHDPADDLLRQRDLSDEHVMPACKRVRFQQEGEFRAVLRVVEPQRVPRPVLRSDIERCQVFTTGLHNFTITTAASPRSAANHPPPVCLACQVRTYRRVSPTGVMLLLLSPSASPERVWLYAAELDEHLLAPHILISSRLRSRQHAHFRSFPRYPGVRKTTNSARNNRIGEIGNTGRATQDAPDQARPCRTAWGPGQMTPTNTDLGNPPLPNIYREIR
jgi:hypothetical protein